MKEIIKILKNYKLLGKFFYLVIFILLLTESTFLIFPMITKHLMNILETKGDINDLFLWGGIGFILIIISVSGWYLAAIFNAKIWAELYKKRYQFYRKKLFDKSYNQILNEGIGKLITRFTRGAESEANIFLSVIHILTNTIFKVIVIVVIFIYFLPWFIVILLVFLFCMLYIGSYTRLKIKKLVEQENEIYEINNKLMVKMISDFLIIKIFNKEKEELGKSETVMNNIPYYSIKIRKYQILFYVLLFFFVRFLEFGAYIIIGYYILKGQLTIALLVMVTGYIWTMWNPIDTAISELNMILRDIEIYKRLQEFIEQPNDIKNGKENYIYKTGKVEFKKINFSYHKNTQIFENLNLEFLAGKKNALVGHSGGGKSTIIKILLRLYDYQNGEILIDKQNLKNIRIESFYKEIGYLPQEPGIFDGTIRENLEYAFNNNIKNKNKKIWEALEKAQIDDMIKNLEKGLDTELGEKGIKLSGGEKQRLAIARIFLKNPKIIILDEPTSALDSISESKITKAFDELMHGRTSIIIAHRLQTVMHSDKIIVLENGKIEAEGKHKELIKNSNIYKTLVDLQNGEILE